MLFLSVFPALRESNNLRYLGRRMTCRGCPQQSYILGDFNARHVRHASLGHATTYITGQNIRKRIATYGNQHRGVVFPSCTPHSAITTPDIILTNEKTIHIIHVTQGKLTNREYFTIITTTSTTPVTTPSHQCLNTDKANWEKYKNYYLLREKIIDYVDVAVTLGTQR